MTLDIPKNVKKKIDEIIVAEGGDKYTNDPKDRGGPTKYGITAAVYAAFGFNGDVKNCTYDQAVQIFAMRYYYQPKFGQIATVSETLAFEMFDWGVTSGPATAVKALQKALNVLNTEGADYPDITVDGGFGVLSMAALQSFLKRRGVDGMRYLLEMVKAQRRVFYMNIAENDPTQERFENGWQGRVE